MAMGVSMDNLRRADTRFLVQLDFEICPIRAAGFRLKEQDSVVYFFVFYVTTKEEGVSEAEEYV
ncbi:hypothetical protein D3P09_15325 [Paenibacillus pinisoli]|uniref:Uncharacterized protein n=1 Tax=Paenibacillus pinisoli TaxID=1276110 RepID=A0A3A6PKN5_9BACL|nr:hypothetical protein [Paenibacillus pinisoli]RJX38889.1 hypothetical protein D3P09_15325 [Paenibacillus pinisoli]